MKEIAGTEKIVKADLVLLAMGFLGPEKQILAVKVACFVIFKPAYLLSCTGPARDTEN